MKVLIAGAEGRGAPELADAFAAHAGHEVSRPGAGSST